MSSTASRSSRNDLSCWWWQWLMGNVSISLYWILITCVFIRCLVFLCFCFVITAMRKSTFNRRKINTFTPWSEFSCFSPLTCFDFWKHSSWGEPPQRAQVEHSETNRRAEWTIRYETTWVKCCSPAKLGFVPSVGSRLEREAAPLGHTRCRTRHPCKHSRNKIMQWAFRDFGCFPIYLVPYLELVLPCWASRRCVGVVCLCDTGTSHWMLCKNCECKVYFHCPAQQMMWDIHICHKIQEGMAVAHLNLRWLMYRSVAFTFWTLLCCVCCKIDWNSFSSIGLLLVTHNDKTKHVFRFCLLFFLVVLLLLFATVLKMKNWILLLHIFRTLI